MFKIDGQDFEIEHAFLDAILDDEEDNRLIIGLVIEGKRVDDNTLPSIDSETLIKIKKNEICNWQDIAGRTIEWEKPSKNKNRPYAQFYNIGKRITSGYLFPAKIYFYGTDNKVFVRITGLCNSKFNGKERKDLSLEIDTEIRFGTIGVGPHKSEEAARNRLKPFINDEHFIYRTSNLELSNGNIEMGCFEIACPK